MTIDWYEAAKTCCAFLGAGLGIWNWWSGLTRLAVIYHDGTQRDPLTGLKRQGIEVINHSSFDVAIKTVGFHFHDGSDIPAVERTSDPGTIGARNSRLFEHSLRLTIANASMDIEYAYAHTQTGKQFRSKRISKRSDRKLAE